MQSTATTCSAKTAPHRGLGVGRWSPAIDCWIERLEPSSPAGPFMPDMALSLAPRQSGNPPPAEDRFPILVILACKDLMVLIKPYQMEHIVGKPAMHACGIVLIHPDLVDRKVGTQAWGSHEAGQLRHVFVL